LAPERSAPGIVPILTYHSLDESGSVISVAPDVFRAHIRGLRARGLRGVGVGEVVDAWEAGRTLPHTVAIAFDDGFRSVLDIAAPVLHEVGFRATVFAVAGHLGGRNDWPTQARGVPILPLLSARDLYTLAADGFEIGAHGVTHVPLDRLSPGEVESETAGAKQILEDVAGTQVRVFAYPEGRADASVRHAVAARYRAACSTELRGAGPRDDRHWLPRLDMYYFRGGLPRRLLGTSWGAAYVRLRRLGRAVRSLVAAPAPSVFVR
jgi:peptidoglycan/xylan/chitin deacetylase (PgdA/CDA1 family)